MVWILKNIWLINIVSEFIALYFAWRYMKGRIKRAEKNCANIVISYQNGIKELVNYPGSKRSKQIKNAIAYQSPSEVDDFFSSQDMRVDQAFSTLLESLMHKHFPSRPYYIRHVDGEIFIEGISLGEALLIKSEIEKINPK